MNEFLKNKISTDYKNGESVEAYFIKLMIENGYDCGKSKKNQDRYEHWDVITYKDGCFEQIDVKSRKKSTDDNRTWVELKNVEGRDGWLYSKHMDVVAFEKDDRFDMVKRIDLLNLVDNELNDRKKSGSFTIVFEKPNENYVIYSRVNWGRADQVILVPFEQIDKIIYKTIYK